MNNKFWREAREICRLFCLEYECDPDFAISNLEVRLKDKRKRIKDMTFMLVGNRFPGVLNG